MLENIAHGSAHTFSGAIIMPNLVPPVSSKEEVVAYKERLHMVLHIPFQVRSLCLTLCHQ
jgi:dihydroorotase